jgi:hypothetical protein
MWESTTARRVCRTVTVLTFVFLLVLSPLAGTVSFSGTVAAASGDVLYRVNAGGPELAALDTGPAWSTDTETNPSPYHVSTDGELSSFPVTQADSTLPSTTPSDVFLTARWDRPTLPELQ